MLVYETEALATEAETKAFSVETQAKIKTFSLEAEARPRRLKFQRRRDGAEALTVSQDGLETGASRPRPHPWHLVLLIYGKTYITIYCTLLAD